MKKILLTVLSLFIISGCSSNNTTDNNDNEDESDVTVEEYTFEGESDVDAVKIDDHIYWTYNKNYSINAWESSAPCKDYNHIEILGTITNLCDTKVFPTENNTANFEEAKDAQYGKVHDEYVIQLDDAWYYLYDEEAYLILMKNYDDDNVDEGKVQNLFCVQLEGTKYYAYGDVINSDIASIEILGTIKDHCDIDEEPTEDETCNRWLAGVQYGKLNDQYVIEDLTGWHYLTTEIK